MWSKHSSSRARITSRITRESRELTFAVIHLGEQVLHAGVRNFQGEERYLQLVEESMAAFSAGDFTELLSALDEHYGGMLNSLRSLFKDEQKRILDIILSRTLQDAENSYHAVYEKHGPLLRFIRQMGQPVPEVLRITTDFVLNRDLKKTFDTEPVDYVRIAMLMEMLKSEGVQLDEATVGYSASNSLTRLLQQLEKSPQDRETLERAFVLASLFTTMSLPVNYWHAQNIYYAILHKQFPGILRRPPAEQRAWRERFLGLGEKLNMSVPALVQEVELPIAS